MTKQERPTPDQYYEILLGLRCTLTESRDMLLVFDKLDHGVHLRKKMWKEYLHSSFVLRGFIYSLEKVIRNVVKEAYYHHPGSFDAVYGGFIESLKMTVEEGEGEWGKGELSTVGK
jgi:hypothetical protein